MTARPPDGAARPDGADGTPSALAYTPDPAQLRRELAEALRRSGACRSPEVTRALLTVPRHLFLPGVTIREAYADTSVVTRWDGGLPVSSASQPAVVALMLEQVQVKPGMRVLEIGAGTGYNAALLAELAGRRGHVVTLDVEAAIVAEARAHLDAAGYAHVDAHTTDGAAGWPAGAPFDRIMLTASAEDIAPAWFEQLADEGVLVVPLRLPGVDVSVALRRQGAILASESLVCCSFMPLRGVEAGAERSVTLPGGRHLIAEDAGRLAAPVAALLATPPRRRFCVPPSQAFLQYLGLRGLHVLSLVTGIQQGKRRSRVRARFGLFVPPSSGAGGGSLALFSATRPTLLVFGGDDAERELAAAQSEWQHQRIAPLEAWRVRTYPRAVAAAHPVPAGALRVERRHFTFDVDVSPPMPEDSPSV